MKKTLLPLSIALLVLLSAGCSSSNEYAAPDEVATLVEEWGEAVNRADGSVIDFYRPGGYHVYGSQRIAYDDIASHLDSGWTGELITDPLLVVDDEDGRYVVVCGVRNTHPSGFSVSSALSFEIVTTADDELQLAQTSWLYQHDL